MTRINVVPVEELCDKHLLAEFRELTRIPNAILSGKAKMVNMPSEYRLGTGHVKFFYNKVQYLFNRYKQLHREGLARGFNIKSIWPEQEFPSHLCQDYVPTDNALTTNRERISIRMPANAKFTKPDYRRVPV